MEFTILEILATTIPFSFVLLAAVIGYLRYLKSLQSDKSVNDNQNKDIIELKEKVNTLLTTTNEIKVKLTKIYSVETAHNTLKETVDKIDAKTEKLADQLIKFISSPR